MTTIKKRNCARPVKKIKKELVGLKLPPNLVHAFDLVSEFSGIKKNSLYQQALEFAFWNLPIMTDEAEKFETIHKAYINAITEKEERNLHEAQDYLEYLQNKNDLNDLMDNFNIEMVDVEDVEDIVKCTVCGVKAFDSSTKHCYFCLYTETDE